MVPLAKRPVCTKSTACVCSPNRWFSDRTMAKRSIRSATRGRCSQSWIPGTLVLIGL